MRLILEGNGASRGMALGRARLEQPSRFLVDETPLEQAEVDAEVQRIDEALATARGELKALRDKLEGPLAREVAEFIDAHSLILEDPVFIHGLHELIRTGRYHASAALKMQRESLVAVFEAMDDPYLRSRREDIEHVIGRVQGALSRESSVEERKIASRVGEILVSDTVAPSELVPLAEHGVLGFVLTAGSTLSHSAILARSLRLPMVVGSHDALSHLQDGDLLLIDGDEGRIIVHPTAQDLAGYRHWQREVVQQDKRRARLRDADTRTRDGVPVQLYANAEMSGDVAQARAYGAAGIGLYRTEFLFLQRKDAPGEEEQFLAYRDLVLGMGGLPVTIRTLDLGADKVDSAGLVLQDEPNPALGVRGVRLSLRTPQLMHTQLRAILRTTSYGPVRILVPMVSATEEMITVRRMVTECAMQLRSEGHPIADSFEIGAMIEVPAAAIALPSMIRKLDFVSIGTNDLVQYTLAVDRNNNELGALYDPLHPAVLRLLAHIIAVCKRARRPVTLCGEIAGDVHFTAMLIALGLTEFSMHPGLLLEVREAVNAIDAEAVRKVAPVLLRASGRESIRKVVERMRAQSRPIVENTDLVSIPP
ncbi:phosphoenolpyruvate--protein phosphotransferase [Dokdonella immobilis]|uniref:Phosphoenolpyruvate-protein phosphotransferase n=1 Tax=Dokdonella immobilis TaxID=578942 RepID=A0A1I4XDQ2_9GAMM|nr:phosphoenolpyruvate--protein phosphotransferase [Dokdonella immobilis]SFN24027.1 phosphoenolpyruvate--protein phosphotransferase [Dokdonella immobilis]